MAGFVVQGSFKGEPTDVMLSCRLLFTCGISLILFHNKNRLDVHSYHCKLNRRNIQGVAESITFLFLCICCKETNTIVFLFHSIVNTQIDRIKF